MSKQASRANLTQFIEAESESLLATLRLYIVRGGLADYQAAALVASELLNDVVVEALEHAERFEPERSVMNWLLGIAANLIKRRQAERAKRDQREPLARDLVADEADALSDGEIFDRFAGFAAPNLAENMESQEAVEALLAGLAEADRQVLRLAILHDMDGKMLAKELGTGPGAARMRLHRALNRLRESLKVDADV